MVALARLNETKTLSVLKLRREAIKSKNILRKLRCCETYRRYLLMVQKACLATCLHGVRVPPPRRTFCCPSDTRFPHESSLRCWELQQAIKWSFTRHRCYRRKVTLLYGTIHAWGCNRAFRHSVLPPVTGLHCSTMPLVRTAALLVGQPIEFIVFQRSHKPPVSSDPFSLD